MIGITGATGFVGMVHVASLVRMGVPVRILVREGHPYVTEPPQGVEVAAGSLEDRASLERFGKGLDVCFHYAARAAFKGEYAKFLAANIEGTQNLIDACREVPRLVACSTQAVALENRDIFEQSEAYPYPADFVDHYGASKAQVEQMVVTQHPGGSVIRPPWTWGAGDTNNLPTLIKPHMAGRMSFFGDGSNLLECLHVANFVHAAMLIAQTETCRQQIYFASDDQPIPAKTLINDQLVACGFAPATRHLPKFIAPMLLWSERLADIVGSKSSVIYTFRTQTFSDTKLREATGYQALVARQEGLQELGEWVRYVGGPKTILRGRRRGEAKALVDLTWQFLTQESTSVAKIVSAHRAR